MADMREPPPLFDDEDSRKDDENDDLFASAVQSPMSEVTTPPVNHHPIQQDDVGLVVDDPLSAPAPVMAATITVTEPPIDGDLFGSDEERISRGFSSVALDESGEATQQVCNSENTMSIPVVDESVVVASSACSDVGDSTSMPSQSQEQQSSDLVVDDHNCMVDMASDVLLNPGVGINVNPSVDNGDGNMMCIRSHTDEQFELEPIDVIKDLDQFPIDSVKDDETPIDFVENLDEPIEDFDKSAIDPIEDFDKSIVEENNFSQGGDDVRKGSKSNFLDDEDTTEILLESNDAEEVSLDDDPDDGTLFQSAISPQLQLNQEKVESVSSTVLPPMGAPITPPDPPSITPPATTGSYHLLNNKSTPYTNSTIEEQMEHKSGDEFIEITVSDPQKIGDGMGAYMAYKVTTKTNIPYLKKKNWSVTRRFSDFLGLHGKLVEKHLTSGRIIPPAPEKSAIASTKIKLGSDKNSDSGSTEFIERRRAALERYMSRTGAHPVLRTDPDFREFIELDSELPKATQTSAMSSAGVLRLFNRFGETVNKMTYKMEESDQWFEEKTQQIESIDSQLRKIHAAMEGLVGYRRELANSTLAFSKSSALLSSVEEHTALSRALHQLAEATEHIHTIHHAQGDADFFHLSETTKDYINLIGAVKDVFHERVKNFQMWQHAQTMLAKKREGKAKAEMVGKLDKVQQAQEEVQEWENKVERGHTEFERISRAIQKEIEQFDIVRVADFKDSLVKYLEALVTSQQQIIKVWETFLPEAKAIV